MIDVNTKLQYIFKILSLKINFGFPREKKFKTMPTYIIKKNDFN